MRLKVKVLPMAVGVLIVISLFVAGCAMSPPRPPAPEPVLSGRKITYVLPNDNAIVGISGKDAGVTFRFKPAVRTYGKSIIGLVLTEGTDNTFTLSNVCSGDEPGARGNFIGYTVKRSIEKDNDKVILTLSPVKRNKEYHWDLRKTPFSEGELLGNLSLGKIKAKFNYETKSNTDGVVSSLSRVFSCDKPENYNGNLSITCGEAWAGRPDAIDVEMKSKIYPYRGGSKVEIEFEMMLPQAINYTIDGVDKFSALKSLVSDLKNE